MLQRGQHPFSEVMRVRRHQRQLHAPPRDVKRVTDALRRRAGQPAANELRWHGQHEASGVFLAGVAGEAGEVLHASVLEVFEAVEGETRVRDHAH